MFLFGQLLLSSTLNRTLTLHQDVKLNVGFVWSLKRIDDELWCCHNKGITVYSVDLNKLRNIILRSGEPTVHSVALLDVNAVVIATDDGLSTCSKQG